MARRPAHEPGRAARRAPLDRALRLHGALPRAARRHPRLLPRPLPADRRRARARRYLNPGAGWVSALCARAARRARGDRGDARAAPLERAGCACCSSTSRSRADIDGDRVRAVAVRDSRRRRAGRRGRDWVLDATETGELLPLSGTEHVTGCESREETGEPHAPAEAQPLNMQAVSVVLRARPPRRARTTRSSARRLRLLAAQRPPGWPEGRSASSRPTRGRARRSTRTLRRTRTATRRPSAPTTRDARRSTATSGCSAASRRAATSRPAPTRATSRSSTGRRSTTGAARSSTSPTTRRRAPRARPASSACCFLTGCRPRRRAPTAAPAGPGCACAATSRRHARRAGAGALHPRVAPHPRRAHRRRAGHRARRARRRTAPSRTPTASASARTGSTCTRRPAATPTSTSRCCPFQIPLGALIPVRLDNLLPAARTSAPTHITNGAYRAAPGRVEHRRGRRRTSPPSAPRRGTVAARGPRRPRPARRRSSASSSPPASSCAGPRSPATEPARVGFSRPMTRTSDSSPWDRLRALPLVVESYELDRLSATLAYGFERVTTRGPAARRRQRRGCGEDVSPYEDEADTLHVHRARCCRSPASGRSSRSATTCRARPVARPAGAGTMARRWRNWAFESAALDLALNQAGRALHEALGRPRRGRALRQLARPRRPADLRPDPPPARAPPRPALQARRDRGVDARADRRGRGDRARSRSSTSRATTGSRSASCRRCWRCTSA